MTILQLVAARDEAQKALLAAKTETERKAASAAFQRAALALATAKAAGGKMAEDESEDEKSGYAEDEDEDEDEEESEEESKGPKMAKPKMAEEDEDEDEKDDEDEDEDEDSTAGTGDMPEDEEDDEDTKSARAKFLASKLGAFSPKKMLALVSQLTGERNPVAAMGALAAMPRRLAKAEAVAARVEKLEKDRKAERVESLIASARTEGRITAAQAKDKSPTSLRALGVKQGPKYLKAFLANLPRSRRTDADAPLQPAMASNGTPSGAPSNDEQRKILTALGAGVPDASSFAATVIDLHARKAGGSKPRI